MAGRRHWHRKGETAPVVVTPPPTPIPQPTPKPPATTVPGITLAVRGQSNGYLMNQYGHISMMAKMITEFTGLPVELIARQENPPNTMHAGTGTLVWLNTGIADEVCRAYATASKDFNKPFIDLALHWEDDIKQWEQTKIEQYPAAHIQLRDKIKAAVPPRVAYLTLLAHCSYVSGTQGGAVSMLNATWIKEVSENQDIRLAIGNGLDCKDIGDGSHWDKPSSERVARRLAVSISRMCYENGWTQNDLSMLQTLGPIITDVAIHPTDNQAVVCNISYQAATGLVLNDADPKAFGISGEGVYKDATSLSIEGKSLVIRFPVAIPPGARLSAYNYPDYYGTRVVTDNWHLLHGDVATFPIARSLRGIPVQNRATGTPTPTPTPPVPLPPEQKAVDWSAIGRVVQDYYNKTGMWRSYEDIIAEQQVPTVPPPTPLPNVQQDVDRARMWYAQISGPGLNIERMRPLVMKYEGVPLTQAHYYDYLIEKGVRWVRMFHAYRPTQNLLGEGILQDKLPAVDKLRAMIHAAQSANAAGMPVMLLACDVMGTEDFVYWDTIKQWLTTFANEVKAANIPPDLLVVGMFNELAGADNPTYNNYRLEGHSILRSILPKHTIVHGCANWNDYRKLDGDWEPPPDFNVVTEFHVYEQHDAIAWWHIYQIAQTHSLYHANHPVMCGELGPSDVSHTKMDETWLPNLKNAIQGMPLAKPAVWAVTNTDGDGVPWFRLNRSNTDPTLHGDIEAFMLMAQSTVKATPGWNE